MELTIALLDKNDQVTLKKITPDKIETSDHLMMEVFPKEDLNENRLKENSEIFGVFYSTEKPEIPEDSGLFILPLSQINLERNMPENEILPAIKEFSSHQSLKSIFKSFGEIFLLSENMAKLYTENRNDFFKSLWKHCLQTLCPFSLEIFYFNLNPKKENTLLLQKISGINKPKYDGCSLEEEKMFDTMKEFITPIPNMISHDLEKHEVTLSGQIQGTNFLIMVKTLNFTLMQKTFFTTLLKGINYQLGTKTSK